jgi:acetyltransferase-like isoleucine patch superfamily enzyme/acyl carrier protein
LTSRAVPEVRQAVLAFLAGGLTRQAVALDEVQEDFDLLSEGVIDSFGLLELIASLEETYGVELDFEGIDADELTVFGPFCRYVETKVAETAEQSNGDAPAQVGRTSPPPFPVELTAPGVPAVRGASAVIRGIGRSTAALHRSFVRARDKAFSVALSGSFGSFGRRTVLQLPIRLSGQHRIAIGSNGFVGANSWLQVLEEDGADQIAISIGDGVSIAGLCVLSAVGSIRIGHNVSFARNVYIADHTHLYDDPSSPVLEQGVTASEPVEIGDGAWLGENVLVLPGVRIGRGAVISANSVVNQDIPDHCVAAGSPARVVRHFGGQLSRGSSSA